MTLAEAGFPMLHGTSLGSLFLCSQTASQPNQRSIWTFWIGCPPDLGLGPMEEPGKVLALEAIVEDTG